MKTAPPDSTITVAPLVYGITDLGIALGGNNKPLSERTIYRLIDRGEIPRPTKLGRRIVWPVEEVKLWLAAGAPSAAEWQSISRRKSR